MTKRKYEPLKLSRDARTLLERAMKVMLQRPETIDMDIWVDHDERVEGKEPYCGTTACIAGHVALAGGCPQQGLFYPSQVKGKYRKYAEPLCQWGESTPRLFTRRLFGLLDDEDLVAARPDHGDRLFMRQRWPRQFKTLYKPRGDKRANARVVVARIRHWMKTGE